MATLASTVEPMMPTAGTPRLDRRRNGVGNSPSFAAASGISAQIIVHPLSAPKPETTTAAATRYPAHVPPAIVLAATEYEALLESLASSDVGTMPNTAVRDSRYTTAAASVPKTVDRGTLPSGSRTLAAATAAVSPPR